MSVVQKSYVVRFFIFFFFFFFVPNEKELRIKNSGYFFGETYSRVVFFFIILWLTTYRITICKNIILYQNCYVPLVLQFLYNPLFLYIYINNFHLVAVRRTLSSNFGNLRSYYYFFTFSRFFFSHRAPYKRKKRRDHCKEEHAAKKKKNLILLSSRFLLSFFFFLPLHCEVRGQKCMVHVKRYLCAISDKKYIQRLKNELFTCTRTTLLQRSFFPFLSNFPARS